MTESVSFNFGDGSNETGVLGEPITHRYTRAGKFTIQARDGAGRVGRTTFEATGTGPDPDPDPAEPTITIANASGQTNQPITAASRMVNTSGESTGVTGKVSYQSSGLVPNRLTVTRDGAAVALTQDGANRISGTYAPDGFVIGDDFDVSVNFVFTGTTVGTINATHQVLDSDGAELAEATFTITLTAPPPPPATGATAGEPGSWTPAGAAAPANTNGITASPSSAWAVAQRVVLSGGGETYWDGSGWQTGRVPEPEPEPEPDAESEPEDDDEDES